MHQLQANMFPKVLMPQITNFTEKPLANTNCKF